MVLGMLGMHAQNNSNTAFPLRSIPLDAGESFFSTTINVGAGTREFNNLLLGSNVDINGRDLSAVNRADLKDAEGNVLISNRATQGFNSQTAQDFIEDRDPVVIRFPQGVFANTYNWEPVKDENGNVIAEADSRNLVDPFEVDGKVAFESDPDVRLGYPALRGIFDRAAADGKPLDLLTVLNIINNDADSNSERWQSMIEDGYEVRDMELGNEFFFREQRSGTINMIGPWLERAKSIVEAIRARAGTERTVRFGLPITYRASDPLEREMRRINDQRFNDLVTRDESFFDAIVVHRYVREQRSSDVSPNQLTQNSLARLLTGSRLMDISLMYAKTQVSESKNSIWLTEWGVAGSREEGVGASFLGTADTYTHLIRNERRLELERTNWFSTFGSNAQYKFNDKEQRFTTGYGRIYEMFRGSLRDSDIFNTIEVQTAALNPSANRQTAANVEPSEAVNALAIRRSQNSITYLVTNLANVPTRLFLERQGNAQNGFDVTTTGLTMPSLIATVPTILEEDRKTNENYVDIPEYTIMKLEVNFNSNSAKNQGGASIESIDQEHLVVLYPNPSGSKFKIVLNGMENANVEISDLLGKVVYQTETTKGQLELEKGNTFKTGVYLVKVTNKTYNSKLVIE